MEGLEESEVLTGGGVGRIRATHRWRGWENPGYSQMVGLGESELLMTQVEGLGESELFTDGGAGEFEFLTDGGAGRIRATHR